MHQNGTTPLHLACESGHNSTVQLLLSHGANFNACDVFGQIPFFEACYDGHVSTLQL